MVKISYDNRYLFKIYSVKKYIVLKIIECICKYMINMYENKTIIF